MARQKAKPPVVPTLEQVVAQCCKSWRPRDTPPSAADYGALLDCLSQAGHARLHHGNPRARQVTAACLTDPEVQDLQREMNALQVNYRAGQPWNLFSAGEPFEAHREHAKQYATLLHQIAPAFLACALTWVRPPDWRPATLLPEDREAL